MRDRKDPESTRCTFIVDCTDSRLFQYAAPGDRIELFERKGGRPTGVLITARVLRVDRVPARELSPAPEPDSSGPL